MSKIIVFDFDKTLTYQDSLTQFFYERMKGKRAILLPFYFFLKILSKFHFISIQKEKELAFSVLCPKSEALISDLLRIFACHIRLNPINKVVKSAVDNGAKVIILSASPEVYLKELYPNCEVVGLQYIFTKGFMITQHPYGAEKMRLLKQKGIMQVDEFFYDSKSDELVFPICKKAIRIRDGQIVEEKLLNML